jgi:transposase-like protein
MKNNRGFSCPACDSHDTKVTGGERRGMVRVRYRRCACGKTFSTVEAAKYTRHTQLAEAEDTLQALSEILSSVQERVTGQLAYIGKAYGNAENIDDERKNI